jgi:hypothetical protein
MEDDLKSRFYITCAPGFFSEELKVIINSFFRGELTCSNAIERITSTLDIICSMVGSSSTPLNKVLAEILVPLTSSDFILSSECSVDSKDITLLKVILHLELLRVKKFSEDSKFLSTIAQMMKRLQLYMSIGQGSESFFRDYSLFILPRYAHRVPKPALLALADLMDLREETEEQLASIFPANHSENTTLIKQDPEIPKLETQTVSNRIVLSRERVDYSAIKANPVRNLTGHTLKKRVALRNPRAQPPKTPESQCKQISEAARRLKDMNSKFFYSARQLSDKEVKKKRKLSDTDLKEILVTSTPTKPVDNFKYDLTSYRNIFNSSS